MKRVKKLRLTVYRKWGQIAVKDFAFVPLDEVFKYANETWKDQVRKKVKVYWEDVGK